MKLFNLLHKKKLTQIKSDSIKENREALIKRVELRLEELEEIIGKDFPDDIVLEEIIDKLWNDLTYVQEQLKADRWKESLLESEIKRLK